MEFAQAILLFFCDFFFFFHWCLSVLIIATCMFLFSFFLLRTDATDGDSEEEYPVQGPINKEPEEKLYPYQKESGIRKL